MRDGLPVTLPGRTFTDLAHHLDMIALVTVGDALVRRTGVTPAELIERAATFTGRGARRARSAAGLVRPRVDSPMETRLRLLLVQAGLPEPLINTDVMFADGGWLGRPDLQYPLQKIAIDYDGRHHIDDRAQWHRDIGRRENYAREGWLVRIVTATDIYSSPVALLGRIHDDLLARNHPAVPCRLTLPTRE